MSEAPLESQAGQDEASLDQTPPTFEQAIEQLESIIEGIESGQVGLEKSLAEYERGMKLIRHCRGVLERAEQRIEQLTIDGSGQVRRADEGEAGADDGA